MIYLDNAATTKCAPEVVEAMLPWFSEYYGNPSSVYELAGKSKEAVDEARRQIAGVIGAKENEIYFTAGGTEADNWAIKAAYEACKEKGNHIITSKVEHHAVLHTCQWLEKQGARVTYLDVDENGIIRLEDLERAITPETILITIMAANNEIGSVMPYKEIGMIAREHAHKINGPKGCGCLYIRRGVKIRSFIHGGAQERKRRAGTENVPGIVGFGKAAQRAAATMEERTAKERRMRDYMISRIREKVPYCRLNGHPTLRLPNNVNFSFQFIEGESLLIMLDMEGICASSGSACTSGSLDPSHVLLAIGLPHEIAHGSLRLTLNEEIMEQDVDFVVEKIAQIVEKLRNMSPLYEDFIKKQK